jgi:hypothetical protein
MVKNTNKYVTLIVLLILKKLFLLYQWIYLNIFLFYYSLLELIITSYLLLVIYY